MTTASITELQQENDRLKSEINELTNIIEHPRTAKIQSDMWTHEIYLSARKRMMIGVLAVLSFVGLASGGSLYLEYKEITKWLETTMRTTIQQQITANIDATIKVGKQRINDSINSEIIALKNNVATQINSAKLNVEKEIKVLKSETIEFKKNIQNSNQVLQTNLEKIQLQSDLAVEKIKQTVIGAEQTTIGSGAIVDTLLRTDQATAIAKAQCDNQIADGANYSIKQLVINTGKKYKDRPYYKNSFSVAAVGTNNTEFSTATTECFIDAVDRVVYTLSERWFNPNKIVRITRNDHYSFSTNVWGSTAIKVEIYLKDKSKPLLRCGRFLAKSVTSDKPEFFRSTNCSL